MAVISCIPMSACTMHLDCTTLGQVIIIAVDIVCSTAVHQCCSRCDSRDGPVLLCNLVVTSLAIL